MFAAAGLILQGMYSCQSATEWLHQMCLQIVARLQRLGELSGQALPAVSLQPSQAPASNTSPAAQSVDGSKPNKVQQQQERQHASKVTIRPVVKHGSSAKSINSASDRSQGSKATKSKGVHKLKGGPRVRKGEQARKAALQAKVRAAVNGQAQ